MRTRSASAWVFDDGDDGVFGFKNVCDVLGIDGEALRARVRERAARKSYHEIHN